jgi:hypothetical protein
MENKMNDEQKLMSDAELDRLLALATTPNPAHDFESRLLAKLNQASANNLVSFPQRNRAKGLIVGLPLAASLAFGLWLGASGTSLNILPIGSTEVATTDVGSATGFDDLVSIIEGETS